MRSKPYIPFCRFAILPGIEFCFSAEYLLYSDVSDFEMENAFRMTFELGINLIIRND